jgi:hypothetical protein
MSAAGPGLARTGPGSRFPVTEFPPAQHVVRSGLDLRPLRGRGASASSHLAAGAIFYSGQRQVESSFGGIMLNIPDGAELACKLTRNHSPVECDATQ